MTFLKGARKSSGAAWKGMFYFVPIFFFLVHFLPVQAQIIPVRVEINGVDATNFPEVRVFMQLRGFAPGTILPAPAEMNLRVIEDDQEQKLVAANYVDAGVSLAFVIDSGDGVQTTGIDLPQVYQGSEDIIYSFTSDRTWMQPDLDTVSVLAQGYEDVALIISRASRPEKIIAVLDEYEPAHRPVIAAPDSGQYTQSLLMRGLEEFESEEDVLSRQKVIILFTPGFIGDMQDVVVLAQEEDIRIHVILVRDSPSTYWATSSRLLAEKTGGEFLELCREPDLVRFLDSVRQSGKQIMLTYLSGSAVSDHRVDVLLDYEGRKVTSSLDYSINLLPPSLSISLFPLESIDLQDYPQIVFSDGINSDDYILVRGDVDYPDGHLNRSGHAVLHLDGIPAAFSEVTDGEVSFILECDQIFLDRGEEILLSVVLTDQFGFEVVDEEMLDPLMWSGPGKGSRIILISVIAVVFTCVIIVIALIRSRKPGRNLAPDTGVVEETLLLESETKNREQVSPKAFLVPLQGFPEGTRNVYELYGTTSIGRSMRFADIIFHHDLDESAISRLHLTIIDEDDHFALRDEDSSHGTFLNDELLTAFQIVKLTDGDILDLGRVERGGIKLMFKLEGSDCHFNSGSQQPNSTCAET